MDPNFNEGWSSSEIDMVKSLITSHITNKTYTNDTNKKHNEFVDDLQTMFPWKEKHQVINLYVELVVEMTMAQSSNQHVVGSSALVNVVPKKRRHAVKFWTTYEHRSFTFALIVLDTFVTYLMLIFRTINNHVVFRISYHEMLRFHFHHSLDYGIGYVFLSDLLLLL
jgi:hypothetical protein